MQGDLDRAGMAGFFGRVGLVLLVSAGVGLMVGGLWGVVAAVVVALLLVVMWP